MSHYLKYFAAIYGLVLLLLGVLYIIGLNFSVLSLLPALCAAAGLTAKHFIKKQQRLPNTEEKIQLVWGSSAIAIVMASVLVCVLVVIHPNAKDIIAAAEKTGIAMTAMIMLCLVTIHGVLCFVAYGWYASLCLKRQYP